MNERIIMREKKNERNIAAVPMIVFTITYYSMNYYIFSLYSVFILFYYTILLLFITTTTLIDF